MKRKILIWLLVGTMCFSTVACSSSENVSETDYENSEDDKEVAKTQVEETITTKAEEESNTLLDNMSKQQLSSIAMLNYMTVLSQEINASANSKLYLDNIYSSIVNNINPNAVDEDSMAQIKEILNTIYSYQSIETKRERMQYLYEQNQANAIQQAIPEPISILSIVGSESPLKMIASTVYMAVDSMNSYQAYLNDVESEYLQESWELDDNVAESLHESRTEAFSYMVDMCQKNNLDGNLALNEKSVENFVTWKNNDNYTRRIEFLEKNKDTYKAYGKYWLVLAESYYEQGNYEKCLNAVNTYEGMQIDTFRKDRDFAKTLSMAIAAAEEIYEGVEYKEITEHYLDVLLENIEVEDWTLRYFAAQSYMGLYATTENRDYLIKAFDLTEENVNYLIDKQYAKNQEYLSDIKKEEAKETASKDEKKEIRKYNKMLKEERKKALPPVYQPLVINCDLLFGLADKIEISDEDKKKVDAMLHLKDKPLFLTQQLEQKYWFEPIEKQKELKIDFDGTVLEIPVSFLAQETTLKVSVIEKGKETVIYDDWKLDEVKREEKNQIDTFTAVYKSKKIKKQDYTDGMAIKIEIIPREGSTYDTLVYELKADSGRKFFILDDVNFKKVK